MFLLNLYFITVLCTVLGHELQQVVVLSRHNLRAPVGIEHELYTKKKWPEWAYVPGFLTQKGVILERSMGMYFSDWLIKEKLFSDNCPSEAFVYANKKERTIVTAKAFVEGAFGNCVKVYYKNTIGADPVFDLIIRNSSEAFKELVLKEMNRKLDEMDLEESFLEMERILDFKNSSFCKNRKDCVLSQLKNEIVYEVNKTPYFNSGSLKIGSEVVDVFLMSYYDGREPEDIAWGEITTSDQLKLLFKIYLKYGDVVYNTQPLARDMSKPLLEHAKRVFLRGDTKFYMMVGHDSNIATVMSTLNVKNDDLHDQIEKTPIGGKMVFEKWYDAANNEHLFRISYVYQSAQQLRDGALASLRNPPEREFLELEGCVVDDNGFCLWSDFLNILKGI